ncbi:hypothetical protein ACFY3O_31830 [Streptomyces sp. NPDC001046]|uniref:hypothetical protein n=1 Tax=Streptomyces sp. NPDC001046 TaxID=3364543 RepID=UPI00367BBB89
MYGHGAAPPPGSAATVISLRVLIAAAGVLTCGVLACVPLFRAAVLRGKVYDWIAAWVSLPLSIICFVVVGSLPEGDHRTDIALAVILLLGLGSAIYFLIVDIGHHSAQRRFAGYPASQGPTVISSQTPYGYPHQATPYNAAATPVPQQQPQPPQPPVPPVPQRPAPARIDQVRAELDELSDYLRRHEGRPDGTPGEPGGSR